MLAKLQRLLFVCFINILVMVTVWGTFPEQATALLRQHHDTPGVLRYHSQVSIKDNTGHAWQVLLFKVFHKGKLQDLHLRLVGFPGVVE